MFICKVEVFQSTGVIFVKCHFNYATIDSCKSEQKET